MQKRITMIGILLCLNLFVWSKEQPHIVYILADDLGLGDLSCYNPDSKILTTHLDDLAKGGLRFTDAHSSSSVCTPTRYSILTGRYSWRTKLKGRVLNAYSPCLIPKSRDTVASLLKRHGYRTAMIGKWHLGLDWTPKAGIQKIESENDVDFSREILHGPLDLGFDYWYGPAASWDMPPYAFIENRKIISQDLVPTPKGDIYPKPEEYLEAEKKGASAEELKTILGNYPKTTWRSGLMRNGIDARDAMPMITKRAVEYIEEYDSNKPMFIYMPLTAPHTPVVPNEKFLGKSGVGSYGDFVLETDWAVGEVMKALKNKGIFENTVVIFTADNGASPKAIPNKIMERYQHNSHLHYAGAKGRTLEAGHRVPFIVSWPKKIKKGGVSKAVVSLNDLYATCAEWMKEEVPSYRGEDSESMVRALEGKQVNERILVHQSFAGDLAIRSGDWKLSYLNTPNKTSLVNLKEDIREEKNLKDQYPERVQKLKNLFKNVIMSGRSTLGQAQSNEGPKVWEQIRWVNQE